MESRGLRWDSLGARVDAFGLFKEAAAECPFRDANNAVLLQILADGVRVFHSNMMTNVGLRAFDTNYLYNSMAAMKLL